MPTSYSRDRDSATYELSNSPTEVEVTRRSRGILVHLPS